METVLSVYNSVARVVGGAKSGQTFYSLLAKHYQSLNFTVSNWNFIFNISYASVRKVVLYFLKEERVKNSKRKINSSVTFLCA